MSKRKTIDIYDLIDTVNRRNRESVCDPKIRQGWNSLLESVMHDAGVYAGFGYLKADEVPGGEKPGIIPGDSNQYPDESRVFYYLHRTLRRD